MSVDTLEAHVRPSAPETAEPTPPKRGGFWPGRLATGLFVRAVTADGKHRRVIGPVVAGAVAAGVVATEAMKAAGLPVPALSDMLAGNGSAPAKVPTDVGPLPFGHS